MLPFTITLSAPSLAQVAVVFSTANGTAIAGSDYLPVQNLNVSFPPGTTSVTRNVTLLGDNAVEGNETFTPT